MSRTAPVVKLRNVRATNLDVVALTVGDVAVSASAAELNKLDGIPAAVYPMLHFPFEFTETSGAGTYTASIELPAGATLHDIIINGVALWDNAGTATLIAGDTTDPDGYYTAVNLKATDLLAGESISFALAGGKAGAYIANSQVSPRYSATARTVSVSVTTASTGGTAGRTNGLIVYAAPTASTAATKVHARPRPALMSLVGLFGTSKMR